MDPRILLNPKALKKSAKQNATKRQTAPKPVGTKPGENILAPRPDIESTNHNTYSSSTSTTDDTSPRARREYDPWALLSPGKNRSKGPTLNPAGQPSHLSSTMASNHSQSPQPGTPSKIDFASRAQSQHEDRGSRPMLEGLYGVEARDAQPRKKLKTAPAADEPATAPRSTYTHKTNGIVGEYMKPDPNASPSAAQLSNLVDLTSIDDDHDDEIQITGSRNLNDQEVCYGHVSASVHAYLIPKPKSESIFGRDSEWPVMKCTLVRNPAKDTVIDVVDPADKPFGKINHELAAALAPAMDGLIGLRTQARLTNRRKKGAEWPHQPCSEHLRMIINIYGRRGDAERIGKRFGQHNIWFGQPMAPESGIPILNPHARMKPMVSQSKRPARGNVLADNRTVEQATEAVSKLFDYFAADSIPLPETNAPPAIMTTLLPHQKQALTFMIQQENPRTYGSEESENSSLWRREYKPSGQTIFRDVVSGHSVGDEPEQVLGGLLADVMGLGKTLEALSLIASTVDKAREFGREGIIRKEDEAMLLAHSKGTLVVCPTSTVKNWEDQIKDHIQPGSLTYCVYHGPGRIRNPHELSKYDIVIATYGVITSDFSGRGTVGGPGPIRQLKWFRIILDEAHTIREAKAAQTQAMYSLWGQRRWCLTGTPIQNRIDDLGSLTRFLRLHPYDTALRFNQYIRAPAQAGDPSFLKALRVFVDSFTLRRLRDRIDLPNRQDLVEKLHFTPSEQQMHDFFKEIAHGQIQQLTKAKEKRSGVQHHVLRGIMTLRLICAHGRDLLKEKDLDQLKGISASDAIDIDEEKALPFITKRTAYESLKLMAEADLDLCKNCDKVIGDETPQADVDDEEQGARCYVLPCFDVVCADCFEEHKASFDDLEDSEPLECPFCQLLVSAQYIGIEGSVTETIDQLPDDISFGSKDGKNTNPYSGPHTKTLALLGDIAEMNEASKPLVAKGEAPLKCVVFSEFTSHLSLIERALTDNGHTFVRIDGTMSLPKRRKVLEALATDDNVTILLASIKAAGQGLNLTAASRAFIMEPMWNPAAEAQAVDRIYRIGQKREVIIKRYQMEDSIELKIVELQKRKQALADISMNRNHKQLSKKEIREQHMKDILALFK